MISIYLFPIDGGVKDIKDIAGNHFFWTSPKSINKSIDILFTVFNLEYITQVLNTGYWDLEKIHSG